MIGSHSKPTLQESCLVRMVEPLSPKKKAPTIADWGFLTWWPGTESNHRHADFQSAALPTELPGHDGDCSRQKWRY